MQRVLPSDPVKGRIGDLAVGLAADCDAPESAVQELLYENLQGASRLPFAAFVTHDGTWVEGFSGFKDVAGFSTVLAAAEKTPLLLATEDVRKELEKIAETAKEAADKGNWKAVLRAAREAAETTGRCPERTAVKEVEQRARDWTEERFEAVVRAATSGEDLAVARKGLLDVRRQFSGEPEAEEAAKGLKAIQRLNRIRAAEERGNAAPDLREKAAANFADTRWAAMFARKETSETGDKAPS